jgi:uncharacterized protein (TIGR02996 family)
VRKLESAIAADVDGVDAYLVYADALQTKGDPRGELIALQHAGTAKARRAERALLEKHRDYFFGALADATGPVDKTMGRPPLHVEWHLGFFKSARLSWPERGGFANALAKLVALPSARFLRHLAIGATSGTDQVKYGPVANQLAKVSLPHLRSLVFGDFTDEHWEVNWISVGKLAPIYKAFPKLERLRVRGRDIDLGVPWLPALRELSIESEGYIDWIIRALAASKLPKLERLELELGGSANKLPPLRPLLDGKFPALRHLGLTWMVPSRDDLVALATGKTLSKLETLSLATTAITDTKLAVLAEHAKRFAHLASLDLENNWLSARGKKLARTLCSNVKLGTQQDPDPLFEWD